MNESKKGAGKLIRRTTRISEKEALSHFISLHPSFARCWEEAQSDFEENAARMVYISFAIQVTKILQENPREDFIPMMHYVESLMRNGTNEMQGVIAVYFIESILASGDSLPGPFASLFRLFGPLSRAYALEWNTFLGTTNKGLEEL